MATNEDVWGNIRAALIEATSNTQFTDSNGKVVKLFDAQGNSTIFIDLLDSQIASKVAKGTEPPIISIYDYAQSSETTRYLRTETGTQTVNPIGITSSLSEKFLRPTRSVTLTITGTCNPSDGIGFNMCIGPNMYGATAKAINGTPIDTPTTMATALAASINALAAFDGIVSATAASNVVTIQNLGEEQYRVSALTGNTGQSFLDIARDCRPVLIKLVSSDRKLTGNVGYVVKQVLKSMAKQANYWAAKYNLLPSDNTWMRVDYNSDRRHRDTHNVALYCWDFIIECDFVTTVPLNKWSILAINSTVEGST